MNEYENKRKIKEALYENYRRYGIKQVESAIFHRIVDDNPDYFTRNNGAREKILGMSMDEFEDGIIELYIEAVCEKYKQQTESERVFDNPMERVIMENFVEHSFNNQTGREEVILRVGRLQSLLRSVASNSVKSEDYELYRKMTDIWHENAGIEWIQEIARSVAGAISEKARDLQTKEAPKNIEIYPENIRQIQERMITGLTPEVEGNAEIGNELYAATRIGYARQTQEDAVLLIKDENLPDFKMMVVSDGMGGHQKRRSSK